MKTHYQTVDGKARCGTVSLNFVLPTLENALSFNPVFLVPRAASPTCYKCITFGYDADYVLRCYYIEKAMFRQMSV